MGWGSLGMGWVPMEVPRDGVGGFLGYGVGLYGGPRGWGGFIWGSLGMGMGFLGME